MAACQDFVKGQLRCIGLAEEGHASCAMHLKLAGWRKCPDCQRWIPPVSVLQVAAPTAVRCGCAGKEDA